MADGSQGTHGTTNLIKAADEQFISEPNFPVNLAAILPCYRESEEELRVSINNFTWRHSHKMTPFWSRDVLVPSVTEEPPDSQDEYTQKLLELVSGMCLFIVVDGSCDVLQESSTLQSVRKVLNIEHPVKQWATLDGMNTRFKEIDGAFGWSCKLVVIVKTEPAVRGKRYSQALCCRLLMRMAERYPDTIKLQYLLLCDADTGFRARDVYKSINRLLCDEHTGLLQVNRRLLNHSFFNVATNLQYLEYNLITMKRKTHCGMGFLATIDGSFIMMRYNAMVDIIEDFSTFLPLDRGNICKYNGSNLGEDTLMARMVNYKGWSVDQLTDSGMNHYLNGVTTLHDLFGQRRRWYSNGISHMMSDILPSHEIEDDQGIWNFTYRPIPRILLHILWLLIGGSIGFLLFIEPGLYLYLWSLTALFLFPSLSPLIVVSCFAVLMMLHCVVSFKQNPGNRSLWIRFVSFLCFALTLISWFCILVVLSSMFNVVDNEKYENMNMYFNGYSFYLAVGVVPNFIQFLFYFLLFNHRQSHLILSMYLLSHIMGGFAIYGFAINIWVVANYFDTKWGTRETTTSELHSIQIDDRQKPAGDDGVTRYFPNLDQGKRPSLLGISICCPRIFQFIMPLIQIMASGVLGYGTLHYVVTGSRSLGLYIPSMVQTLMFVLFMISAKCMNVSGEGNVVNKATEPQKTSDGHLETKSASIPI
jgi:hypothetical protein